MTVIITRPAAFLHHVSGSRLKAMFRAVLAHTADPDSDDFEIPALTQVHIEVRDGELRMACSDRFSMGIVRQLVTSTTSGFSTSFAVPAEDVRLALQHTDDSQVTLIVEEHELRITGGEGPAEIPGVDSILPWRATLGKILHPCPTPTGIIAIDPRLLARFQDAKPLAPDAPMLFQLGGDEGVVIATLGTSFLGIVAPVNRAVATRSGLIPDAPLDGWFDLIDEAVERSSPPSA